MVPETAPLVVGADGKRSFVAKAVQAKCYRQRPVRSFACYTYWAGVPVTEGALFQRPGLAAAVFPTNDDLTMVYLAAPLAGFGAFRTHIESNYLKALDTCGDLGDRLRSGTRAERSGGSHERDAAVAQRAGERRERRVLERGPAVRLRVAERLVIGARALEVADRLAGHWPRQYRNLSVRRNRRPSETAKDESV